MQSVLTGAFAILVLIVGSAKAQSASEIEYNSLHKTQVQNIQADSFDALKRQTDLGYFFPTALLPQNSVFAATAQSVGRLDVLYKRKGEDSYEQNTCTATLVSPDIVISAAHCVPGEGNLQAVKARLVMGYQNAQQSSARIFEVSVAPLENLAATKQMDVVLLRVAIFGQDVTSAKPFYRSPLSGETLYIVQHPLGQGQRISALKCLASNVNIPGNSFLHSCSTLGGSSGALVFAGSDNAIVGVHYRGGGDGAPNYAVRFDKLVEASTWASGTFHRVQTPATLNTSGTILDAGTMRKLILSSFAKYGAAQSIPTLLSETSRGGNSIVGGESLVEIAIEANSPGALRALLKGGANVNEGRSSDVLNELILRYGNSYRKSELDLISTLLQGGVKISPTPEGLPPCGNSDVRELFKKYRPEVGC
ncbi:trypsin-like serine peptidase [Paraburkholderia graminis]|uniref:trypsin-like serine peptidase n=1 Tax=Paraburkholderia graminis TaxID=60548 RepID=UPI0031E02653